MRFQYRPHSQQNQFPVREVIGLTAIFKPTDTFGTERRFLTVRKTHHDCAGQLEQLEWPDPFHSAQPAKSDSSLVNQGRQIMPQRTRVCGDDHFIPNPQVQGFSTKR